MKARSVVCFFKGHNFKKKDNRLFCNKCGKVSECIHKWHEIKEIPVVTDWSSTVDGQKIPVGYKFLLECKFCGDRKVVSI